MEETYCGKVCAECREKEMQNCPGCKAGPGSPYGGDCTLAQCCRDKGHKECSTCGFNGQCVTLRGRDYIPEYRTRRMEAEKLHAQAIAQRAPVLGKWLWILFWLIIPSSVAAIMKNENIAGAIPAVAVPGQILNILCSVSYGLILIRLASEDEKYRKAGICKLISCGISLLSSLLPGSPALIFMIPIAAAAIVVFLIGAYNEITAHADVLAGLDNRLSDRWTGLWKWHIGIYGAMLGSLLVIVIIPILGLLIIIAAVIGMIVVDIIKLVYLYKTAKAFRNFAQM